MKKIVIPVWVLAFILAALVASWIFALVTGEPVREDSPRGFVLPEGDVLAGKQSFADLGCVQCHTVEGVSFEVTPELPEELIVPLGGPVQRAKTYGQLVTSVIHPSETIADTLDAYQTEDGKPMMPDYKAIMSVGEMVDIVAFLREHYRFMMPTLPLGDYPYVVPGGTPFYP